MKKKDGNSKTFSRILRYLKPYGGYLAATVFLAIVTVAAQLAVPFLAGLAVDKIAGAGNVEWRELFNLFIAIAACVGGAALSQWLMSLSNNPIAYHVL